MKKHRISLFNKYDDLDIPDHTKEAIDHYLLHGFHPSGFLEAVLHGDLHRAVQRADHLNKQYITPITLWILEFAPSISYHSVRNIEAWVADENNVRTKYYEEVEKKRMWEKLNGGFNRSEVPF